MVRSVQVLLGLMVLSGLISVFLALAPFLNGSQEWATILFRVSLSPNEPIVFALLFLFTASCAIRFSQNWAIFGSLSFLALAVLPFIADGRPNPTVAQIELLEEARVNHSAALAGISSSIAAVNRRIDGLDQRYVRFGEAVSFASAVDTNVLISRHFGDGVGNSGYISAYPEGTQLGRNGSFLWVLQDR